MSYQVIARKWRPQSFAELVGQEHVSQTLLNALRNDRLHHALLFTGPRGTGKTSSARILAKSLRCPNATQWVPCHVCSICQEIAQSRSIDVIEIDGASNNGVDAIRELRDTVGYMPSSGSKKIYIIDEVHMLSTSAFNALLKTLEEPPTHVLFIMATTEAQKIPQTILSRCQRYDFHRISTREITDRLRLICQTDGIEFEEEALWTLARQGDGSMRDAQSLLDQAIAFTQGVLSNNNVATVLGLTERTLLLEALQAVVTHDQIAILGLIERFSTSGIEPYLFIKDLIESIRNLLLVKISESRMGNLLEMPDSEYEYLQKLGAQVSEEEIHLFFDMAIKGGSDIHRSSDARIVLEVVLLRMASAPRIVCLQTLISRSSTNGTSGGAAMGSMGSGSGGPTSGTSSTLAVGGISHSISAVGHIPSGQSLKMGLQPPYSGHERLIQSKDLKVIPAPLEKMRAAIEKRTLIKDSVAGSHPVRGGPGAAIIQASEVAPVNVEVQIENRMKAPQTPKDEWISFVDSIRSDDALFAAKIENLLFVRKDEVGKLMYLAIPPRMVFLEKQMADLQIRKRLLGYVESFWGSGYSFQIGSPQGVEAGESAASLTQKKSQQEEEEMRHQIKQNHLVQKATEVFRGEIKEILPMEEK